MARATVTAPAISEVKGEKPRGRRVLNELRVRRSLDGGHVITHQYEGYRHEPTEHKFAASQGRMALAHIAKHAGLASGKSEEPAEDTEA